MKRRNFIKRLSIASGSAVVGLLGISFLTLEIKDKSTNWINFQHFKFQKDFMREREKQHFELHYKYPLTYEEAWKKR